MWCRTASSWSGTTANTPLASASFPDRNSEQAGRGHRCPVPLRSAIAARTGSENMDVGLLTQYVMNGLMLGMMYTLVAVGFTLFFGVLDIIKFSHGDVLTVGAFTGLATYIGLRSVGVTSTPLLLLAVVLVAVLAMGAL